MVDNQDMVDLEYSNDQHMILNLDQDTGGGRQLQQQQPQPRNSNAYVNSNNQKTQDKTYKNPYSGPDASKKIPQRQQPTYEDVKSEQPIYIPPFLKENQPIRGSKYNKVNDFLYWSVANIFICVIIALPALFFSVQTRDQKKSGNQVKARSYSKRALILNIFASVIGLLTITLALILRFALYHLFVESDVNSQNVPIYNPYNPYKGRN